MELESLLSEIGRAHSMGDPPGNPNYRLMGLVSDLVELIGQHGLSPQDIDRLACDLMYTNVRALLYRQIEHLRGAACDSKTRLDHLHRGIKILEIDLRAAFIGPPPPREYTPLMLA